MILQRRKANNPPIPWSKEDEQLLVNLLREKKSGLRELAELFPYRTKTGIKGKIRKMRIKHDLFGSSYREEKEIFTLKIAKETKPKVVFDAYAGAGHQSFKWIQFADVVYASERMKSKQKQFDKSAESNGFKKVDTELWTVYQKGKKSIKLLMGDAVEAAAILKANKIQMDLVDLDTCGSTLPLLPTLLVLLKPKHLVITHGEFHSLRFGREDVLRRLLSHRDISKNPLPINIDMMCEELDKAVKLNALRAHNETKDSFWLKLKNETWLGKKHTGMLRRHYSVCKPVATSDCVNELSKS